MSDNTVQSTPKKWLIVVLIYADFRISQQDDAQLDGNIKLGLDRLFKDLVTSPIDSEKIRMYVMMSSIISSPGAHGRNIAKHRLLPYEIISNPGSPTANEVKPLSFKKIDDKIGDFQRANVLAGILKEIPVHSDEEVLLFTWDHGAAFGIFPNNPVRKFEPFEMNIGRYPYVNFFLNKHKVGSPLPKISKSPSVKSSLRIDSKLYHFKGKEYESITQMKLNELYIRNALQIKAGDIEILVPSSLNVNKDVTTIDVENNPNSQQADILNNWELDEAISSWLGKEKHVAVLLMMNCYMMNMHTMYSLRNRVHCLVAAQAAMSNPGYNYKAIIKYLNDNDNISVRDVAKQCVDLSCNEKAKKRTLKMQLDPSLTIDSWSLFAIDLQVPAPAPASVDGVQEDDIKVKRL